MDTNLNIHVRGIDEYSATFQKINQSFERVSQTLETAGRSMRSFGREINQVGNGMVMLGGAITAPLLLAYKDSAQYSAGITQQIEEMSSSFRNLQLSIGEALIPVMEKLVGVLKLIEEKWNSLGKAQQAHIVQSAFMAGQWALYSGIGLKVFGELNKVIGDVLLIANKAWQAITFLFLNPAFLAGAVVIGLIVAAMWKWDGVTRVVAEGFDLLMTGVSAGLRGVLVVFEGFADVLLRIAAFIIGLAEKTGIFSKELDGARKTLDGLRSDLEKSMGTNVSAIGADLSKQFDILIGKNHQAGDSAVDFKNKMKDLFQQIHDGTITFQTFMDSMNNGGGGKKSSNYDVTNDFFAGFKKGIADTQIKLHNFFETGKQAAATFASDMEKTFSNVFYDAFTGNLKKAKDYFVSFGQAILKNFSSVLAQMMTNWVLFGNMMGQGSGGSSKGGLFGSIMSLVGAVGGLSGATSSLGSGWSAVGSAAAPSNTAPYTMPSFDVGTDYVPNDMVAQIHKGEQIIPASQRGKSGGSVTINITPVIQAWDTQDVMRNKEQITNAVGVSIMNNGQLRKIIQQYGK